MTELVSVAVLHRTKNNNY